MVNSRQLQELLSDEGSRAIYAYKHSYDLGEFNYDEYEALVYMEAQRAVEMIMKMGVKITDKDYAEAVREWLQKLQTLSMVSYIDEIIRKAREVVKWWNWERTKK